MSTSDTWFADDGALELELRRAAERHQTLPSIPGFRSLREIGRGGQGVVYAATQTSTRREVALKVLLDAPGSSDAAFRRFEREVAVIARLRHPNIVTVHDSGLTANGQPFLAMELADGVPIDACRDVLAARAAGWRVPGRNEALKLFAAVCDAVAHAHLRGIIHRDLKPGNVLVGADGVAHVLDFGLAKELEIAGGTAAFGSPAAPVAVSQDGQFLGSLPWSAPEQASGVAGAADVRTDVYAFGVMLFQLITGTFPYVVTGGLRAVVENIATAVPPAPSTLMPAVAGDLDTIVLRCLAKEPGRRYQSVAELAADVLSVVAGEPITARRDSAWYLVRHAARRHRAVAIASVVVAVLATVALVVSLKFQREAADERDHVKAEVLKTQAEARRARAAVAFLVDAVAAADPDRNGRDAKIGDMIDQSSARIDTAFAGQDDIRALLHASVRDVYLTLGVYERASEEGEKAVAIERARLGPDDPATLRARERSAYAAFKAGHPDVAFTRIESVLPAQRRAFGDCHVDTLMTLDTLGVVERALGKLDDAERHQLEALAAGTALGGADSLTAISAHENLAAIARARGQPAEATRIQRDVLERRRRVQGPEHSGTLDALSSLVVYLIEEGKQAEALPLQQECVAACERRFGDRHAQTLGARHNLAKLLEDTGDVAAAEKLLREVWPARVAVLGETHPHTLATLGNLASLVGRVHGSAAGLPLSRHSTELVERARGPLHLDTLIAHNNLGGALHDAGDIAGAEEQYRLAADGADATIGRSHYIDAVFHTNHARALITLGRLDAARAELVPARDVLLEKLGPKHNFTIVALDRLAMVDDLISRPASRASRPAPE